ncbi:MAG: cytochrome c peroxidase [Pirellulales bacterium]
MMSTVLSARSRVLVGLIVVWSACAHIPPGSGLPAAERPQGADAAVASAETPDGAEPAQPEASGKMVPLRPVAITVAQGELLVASCSGWIDQIDLSTRQVTAHWQAAPALADLTWDPAIHRLLAVDPSSRQLIAYAPSKPDTSDDTTSDLIGPTVWREVGRYATSTDPVAVQASDDGEWIAVSCRWSRRVNLYRAERSEAHGEPLIRATGAPLDLTLAPHCIVWLGTHGRFLVADAFGGRLAALDPLAGRVTHTVQIDGHNLRGLVLDRQRDEVVIAHQRLTSHLSTTHDHVFWGNVVANLLMSVRVGDLLDDSHACNDYPPLAHWSLQTLGQNKAAGGDPAGVALLPDGGRVVCLAGVGQAAISHRPWGLFQRIATGRGPVAVVVDPGQPRAYVVNKFDDSVTVIDTYAQQVIDTVRLQPTIPSERLTAEQRGEMLFYDARLSLDGWYSCHSCHTDGHTNGLNNDNFGDAHEGAPKRIPSLLGTADTSPWTWRGLQSDLGQQISKSIVSTMQGRREDAEDADQLSDLVAYLNSLPPAPGIDAARVESASVDIDQQRAAGRGLFERLKCADCHSGPKLTSSQVVDVGLSDAAGERQFNPPSLLGVSQRDRWLHDGRARTLRAVFADHYHPDGATAGLNSADLDALVAYLSSL